MKRKAKVAILGMMLQGGAHAAVQTAPATPALEQGPEQVAVAQQVAVPGKKSKGTRGKKAASTKPAEADKPESVRPDAEAGKPEAASEQGVQVRGVRG